MYNYIAQATLALFYGQTQMLRAVDAHTYKQNSQVRSFNDIESRNIMRKWSTSFGQMTAFEGIFETQGTD